MGEKGVGRAGLGEPYYSFPLCIHHWRHSGTLNNSQRKEVRKSNCKYVGIQCRSWKIFSININQHDGTEQKKYSGNSWIIYIKKVLETFDVEVRTIIYIEVYPLLPPIQCLYKNKSTNFLDLCMPLAFLIFKLWFFGAKSSSSSLVKKIPEDYRR